MPQGKREVEMKFSSDIMQQNEFSHEIYRKENMKLSYHLIMLELRKISAF